MPRTAIRVAVLSAVATLVSLAGAQPLPTDPRVVSGTLDNGLKYLVMQHATPPGRAVMWMHVSSGSLNESDKQRGLAHFFEHMAFNGTENFPPGSVVPFFESLGMTFGRDQNAFTSFEQTTYQLSLPNTKSETLAKGLLFFSDVNSRMLLLPAEIESERGVILGERTSRKSAQQRAGEFLIERSAPGSRFSQRLPIGTEESIKTVTRQDFVDYYAKWYGPANSTMLVVADCPPAQVVEQIKLAFNQPGPAKPAPADEDAGVTPYAQSFGVVYTDPELTRASVTIQKVEKPLAPSTTVPQLRDEWVGYLATTAFNRRMSDKVNQGGTEFQSAFAGAGNDPGIMRTITASASGERDKWRPMLERLALEVQRARAFGFTEREIEEARKNIISNFEESAEQEATLPARAFVTRMNNAVAGGEPVMSSAQQLELGKAIFPTITTSECAAWFASTFDPTNVMFAAQLPAMDNPPSDADLLKIGVEALKAKPTQETEAARADTLMKDLPTPGEVTASSTHDASGVYSAWLSNNARFHHRFMDYQKSDVTITITLLGGELYETAADRGVTSAATIALGGGGGGGGRGGRAGGGGGRGAMATQHLTSSDIRSLMTGKKVRVGGRAGADAIQVSVSGAPEDLEQGMQLAYLLLTEPKIEAPAFENWKTSTLQGLEALDKNPMGAFSKAQAAARYPDDPRTQPLTPAHVRAITLEAAQARLNQLIATSPIEVAVVGDISRERAQELVDRYVGSLPKRERVTPGQFANLRALKRPQGPRVNYVEIDTVTPVAGAMGGFYGPDQSNVQDVRAMRLAQIIMSTRMVKQIREQEQLVYSISAGLEPGGTYPGFGMLMAGAPSDPAKADALADRILEMFAAFAEGGPTEEEVAKAKGQIANTLEEQMRQPATWLARLETITYDGLTLDDFMAAPDAYQKITPADILATYKKYYAKDRTVSVKVKPKSGG